MRQLTQHSLQRLLEPRPQSYFYSCPISSTTSPTFTEVNQLTFSTAAEICYSCLTGLYTNNEYYFCIFEIPLVGLSLLPSLIILLLSQVVAAQAEGCSSVPSRKHMNFPSFLVAEKRWVSQHLKNWRMNGIKGCELRSLMLVLELELLVNDASMYEKVCHCKTPQKDNNINI